MSIFTPCTVCKMKWQYKSLASLHSAHRFCPLNWSKKKLNTFSVNKIDFLKRAMSYFRYFLLMKTLGSSAVIKNIPLTLEGSFFFQKLKYRTFFVFQFTHCDYWFISRIKNNKFPYFLLLKGKELQMFTRWSTHEYILTNFNH